jgi:hypothetical protein
MMAHRFDVDAETAHIKDPYTRFLVRLLMEHHNRIWHDL